MNDKRQRRGAHGRRPGATIMVRNRSGQLNPFLRGIVTHDLIQRGLSFDDAYSAAHALRDRLADREEISTSELEEQIEAQVEALFGSATRARLARTGSSVPTEITVLAQGEPQPFSRGLLARSLQAAGLDLDRAYRHVTDLLVSLREEGITRLTSAELARRAGELLEEREGAEAAGRYRTVRRIHRLPRPLVIYLAGATGTGKSTLALEMAPVLRIYRINATDSIRQVMRMLFAPAILPALHSSSFEVADVVDPLYAEAGSLGGGDADDPSRRVTATFDEQATRVCVGVRAVVERAIVENLSIIVEGVHLVPPLIPFADLEGAVHQVPLTLTTLSEEVHRSRFLNRARISARGSERYLEGFKSIRALQDHLINQAEAHDVPIFDTSEGETAVPRALRLVTGLLQKKLPHLGLAEAEAALHRMPTLLLAIDGVADHPVRALNGRTPLQAAETPNLDRLAAEGVVGLADPVAPGVVPDTASGTLALFGQSPHAMRRGPVEALGLRVRLEPGDIALRGNFATLDDQGRIVDRRAGRIRAGAVPLAEALDRMPLPGGGFEEVVVRVEASTEHRLAIVLKGQGLSSEVQGSDPGDGAPPGPPLTPSPLDPADESAVRTARILALFEQEARRVLAAHPINAERRAAGRPVANAVLTRGAGRVHRLDHLQRSGLPIRHLVIGGDNTILGLAGWLGAKAVSTPAMTANLDTDLDAKFDAAAVALEHHDLVVVHVKGADIAAHDLRPDLKVEYIERVDRALGRLLESYPGDLRIAVASDHSTLSEVGQHGSDPVPVLLWGRGVEPDEVTAFDEHSAAQGSLGRFPLQLLLRRLFDNA